MTFEEALEETRRDLERMTLRVAKALEAKNNAYRERNQLVAALSKIFPASLERDPEETDERWCWLVFIDLPTGQAAWHVPDTDEGDLSLFDHLPRETGRVWDGHTTEEKYQRLAALPSTRRNPFALPGGIVLELEPEPKTGEE